MQEFNKSKFDSKKIVEDAKTLKEEIEKEVVKEEKKEIKKEVKKSSKKECEECKYFKVEIEVGIGNEKAYNQCAHKTNVYKKDSVLFFKKTPKQLEKHCEYFICQ